ncbi:hypothetical protein EVAR_39897_1 [Eumeta japonica]|uniref:Uncharacterized protein n=1 Tax=Eumeta variegata TaxID=151549 RepID=A0A4C1WM03_EUMVA|nr:hypothetical protein EVAR_39897_1 [Eumeta japonica]
MKIKERTFLSALCDTSHKGFRGDPHAKERTPAGGRQVAEAFCRPVKVAESGPRPRTGNGPRSRTRSRRDSESETRDGARPRDQKKATGRW